MKRILLSSLMISFAIGATAQRPQTQVEIIRPTSDVVVERPQTQVQTFRPQTVQPVQRPTTAVEVVHPQTEIQTRHPQTQVEVIHAQTEVAVVKPATTVIVEHPQTTVEVVHPQTAEFSLGDSKNSAFGVGGKQVSTSARSSTSMSNFQPKQAKDFTAGKATPVSGGNLSLGNDTNQSEKDAAAKNSTLEAQQRSQSMDVDPKKGIKGLDKLVTDRSKVKGKKK